MFLKKIIPFLIFYWTLASASPPLEYQVKAAYLFNFLKFVEWPWQALQLETADPIKIAIVGKDPFQGIIEEFKKEKIWNRQIQIEYLNVSDPIQDYQMLFFTKELESQLSNLLKKVKDKPILTVGESENFIKYGGIIQFSLLRESIGFSINLSRAKAINLYINSGLLQRAENVVK